MTQPPQPLPRQQPQPDFARRRGLLQIHIATLFFGCAGLFGKLLDVSPATLTAGRTLFGSLALVAACWLSGSSLRIRGLRDWAMLVAAGALLAVHWISFFAAIQVATVAIGLFGFASFPMFVTFLEPLIFNERLTRFDLLAAAAVVLGLLLLAGAFDVSQRATLGVCWGVLSGFTFAVYSLLSRGNVRAYPRLTVTAYQQAFAFVFSAPVAIGQSAGLSAKSLWLMALLGIVFTAAAHALFIGGLKFVRAQAASIIVSLEPVYGVVLAALLLGEIPSARAVVGGALVLAAAIGSTLRISKTQPAVSAVMNG